MDHILDERELCDLECLSNGSFFPLTTYMTQAQYNSCVGTARYHDSLNLIPNGSRMINTADVFPIPIVLMTSSQVPLDSTVSQRPKGLCVYFMGLSGAGKSTLASKLRARIQEEMPHKEITILDADEIRTHLSKGLGFSKADRSTNVRRIGYVASEIVRHGGIVLVANIAPFQEDRDTNRALIESYGTYIEVYVNTAIEECERRDVKGLYKAARAGTLANFTGVSDPFEVPTGSEIILTGGSIEEQIGKVWSNISRLTNSSK